MPPIYLEGNGNDLHELTRRVSEALTAVLSDLPCGRDFSNENRS